MKKINKSIKNKRIFKKRQDKFMRNNKKLT